MSPYSATPDRTYVRLGLDCQVVAERQRRERRFHMAQVHGHSIQLAPIRRLRPSLLSRVRAAFAALRCA